MPDQKAGQYRRFYQGEPPLISLDRRRDAHMDVLFRAYFNTLLTGKAVSVNTDATLGQCDPRWTLACTGAASRNAGGALAPKRKKREHRQQRKDRPHRTEESAKESLFHYHSNEQQKKDHKAGDITTQLKFSCTNHGKDIPGTRSLKALIFAQETKEQDRE